MKRAQNVNWHKGRPIHMNYTMFGPEDGEPVVLIIGLGSQSIHHPFNSFVAPLAAAGYRVIRFDNRDTMMSLPGQNSRVVQQNNNINDTNVPVPKATSNTPLPSSCDMSPTQQQSSNSDTCGESGGNNPISQAQSTEGGNIPRNISYNADNINNNGQNSPQLQQSNSHHNQRIASSTTTTASTNTTTSSNTTTILSPSPSALSDSTTHSHDNILYDDHGDAIDIDIDENSNTDEHAANLLRRTLLIKTVYQGQLSHGVIDTNVQLPNKIHQLKHIKHDIDWNRWNLDVVWGPNGIVQTGDSVNVNDHIRQQQQLQQQSIDKNDIPQRNDTFNRISTPEDTPVGSNVSSESENDDDDDDDDDDDSESESSDSSDDDDDDDDDSDSDDGNIHDDASAPPIDDLGRGKRRHGKSRRHEHKSRRSSVPEIEGAVASSSAPKTTPAAGPFRRFNPSLGLSRSQRKEAKAAYKAEKKKARQDRREAKAKRRAEKRVSKAAYKMAKREARAAGRAEGHQKGLKGRSKRRERAQAIAMAIKEHIYYPTCPDHIAMLSQSSPMERPPALPTSTKVVGKLYRPHNLRTLSPLLSDYKIVPGLRLRTFFRPDRGTGWIVPRLESGNDHEHTTSTTNNNTSSSNGSGNLPTSPSASLSVVNELSEPLSPSQSSIDHVSPRPVSVSVSSTAPLSPWYPPPPPPQDTSTPSSEGTAPPLQATTATSPSIMTSNNTVGSPSSSFTSSLFSDDKLIESLQDVYDTRNNQRVSFPTVFNNPESTISHVLSLQSSSTAPQVPEREPLYDVSDMACDVVLLLNRLNINKFHLVGTSLGGMIAQFISMMIPSRLLSLTGNMTSTSNPAYHPTLTYFVTSLFRGRRNPILPPRGSHIVTSLKPDHPLHYTSNTHINSPYPNHPSFQRYLALSPSDQESTTQLLRTCLENSIFNSFQFGRSDATKTFNRGVSIGNHILRWMQRNIGNAAGTARQAEAILTAFSRDTIIDYLAPRVPLLFFHGLDDLLQPAINTPHMYNVAKTSLVRLVAQIQRVEQPHLAASLIRQKQTDMHLQGQTLTETQYPTHHVPFYVQSVAPSSSSSTSLDTSLLYPNSHDLYDLIPPTLSNPNSSQDGVASAPLPSALEHLTTDPGYPPWSKLPSTIESITSTPVGSINLVEPTPSGALYSLPVSSSPSTHLLFPQLRVPYVNTLSPVWEYASILNNELQTKTIVADIPYNISIDEDDNIKDKINVSPYTNSRPTRVISTRQVYTRMCMLYGGVHEMDDYYTDYLVPQLLLHFDQSMGRVPLFQGMPPLLTHQAVSKARERASLSRKKLTSPSSSSSAPPSTTLQLPSKLDIDTGNNVCTAPPSSHDHVDVLTPPASTSSTLSPRPQDTTASKRLSKTPAPPLDTDVAAVTIPAFTYAMYAWLQGHPEAVGLSVSAPSVQPPSLLSTSASPDLHTHSDQTSSATTPIPQKKQPAPIYTTTTTTTQETRRKRGWLSRLWSGSDEISSTTITSETNSVSTSYDPTLPALPLPLPGAFYRSSLIQPLRVPRAMFTPLVQPDGRVIYSHNINPYDITPNKGTQNSQGVPPSLLDSTIGRADSSNSCISSSMTNQHVYDVNNANRQSSSIDANTARLSTPSLMLTSSMGMSAIPQVPPIDILADAKTLIEYYTSAGPSLLVPYLPPTPLWGSHPDVLFSTGVEAYYPFIYYDDKNIIKPHVQ